MKRLRIAEMREARLAMRHRGARITNWLRAMKIKPNMRRQNRRDRRALCRGDIIVRAL